MEPNKYEGKIHHWWKCAGHTTSHCPGGIEEMSQGSGGVRLVHAGVGERWKECGGPGGSQYLRRASHTLTPLSTLHPETSQLYSQHTWQKCNFSLIMLFADNLEIPKLFTRTHIKWWTLHLSNSTLLLCATWRNPSKATPTRLFYLRISEVEMPKMPQHCSCIIMTKETLMTKRKFGDVGTKWSAFIQTEK